MSKYYRYLLIGAGGTGSHFIGPALAFLESWHKNNRDEWEFTIIDGDNYESGNLERQMFDASYIGMNKAAALADTYSRYPVKYIDKFVGVDDLEQLMEEEITVFLAVDNYSVRSLVEYVAQKLKNVVVINAGNEKHDGSVQLWVREKGKNKTPRISFLHNEISYAGSDDRSTMSCAQVAQMPGGEQLIIANMTAAQYMLTALWRYHSGAWKTGWTELQFDLAKEEVFHLDMRSRVKWDKEAVFEPEIFARAPLAI